MRIRAIVYTSNTGHTKRYADMLGKRTGLPVYRLENALHEIARGTRVIYLGWLFASSVKGYGKAVKHFDIAAVCGVGLCDTGALTGEVRKAISLPDEIPLFTVQGGMDKTRLRGINKFMIQMLIKGMRAKKNPTEDDKRMLELLLNDADYVSEEHLSTVLSWYESVAGKNTGEAE